MTFWNTLYANVLLEFMFVNKLNWNVPKLTVIRSKSEALKKMTVSNGMKNENDGKCSKKHDDSSNINNSYSEGIIRNDEILSKKSKSKLKRFQIHRQ